MSVIQQKSGVSWRMLASPVAAGRARVLVAGVMREWGLPFLVADAALVVGELAANAVGASGLRDVIKVHAGIGAGEVRLSVWDGCDAWPVARRVEVSLETLDLREENFDDNGGWGLSIVESLTRRYWVESTWPRGKWVCAALNGALE